MSEEMKKLIIDGQEFEIVDAAGRDRITVLENTVPSGGGLSITEKNLILLLFGKAAYAEDDAGTAYATLSNLWSGSYHSVAWEGTGYTHGNSDVAVEDGESFTSTITANAGKEIESVTVTMGGETVQGAYSSGTVTIPNVSGNIVITVTTQALTVSSITAVYTQSGTVYDTDSLDSLKSDLVVTANYSGGGSDTVPSTDYTLSGTLLVGTSSITVSYGGKTTTFNVTVTEGTLYALPDIDNAAASSDITVSVSNGNHLFVDVNANSRGPHILSDGFATQGFNAMHGVFFTIPANATLELKVENISWENNVTWDDNRFEVSLKNGSGTAVITASSANMPRTTTGTSSDFNATATVGSSDEDVKALYVWCYRSVDLTCDVKLYVNGTRWL